MNTRVIAVSALLTLGACAGPRPAPIAYDSDTCTRCHMQISDRRFSAVLLTRRGRTLKFDSIECLREYASQPATAAEVASIWVANFARPGELLPVDRARFVDLGASHAPMGETHGWVAVANPVDAEMVGLDTTQLRAWSELR